MSGSIAAMPGDASLSWSHFRGVRRFTLTGAVIVLLIVVVLAIFGPLFAPSYSASAYQAGAQHPEFSWRYLLGSDVTGRPILESVILGARTTFGLGLLAALIAVVGGAALQSLRQLQSRWLAPFVNFIVDLGLLLPLLPLLLVLGGFVTGGNPWGLALIFGLAGMPVVAALLNQPPNVRQDLSWLDLIWSRPSSVAGRLVRVMTLLAVCLVSASATVDFLGLGQAPSNPSWGNALSHVLDYLGFGYWWWVLFPGLILFLTLVAMVLVGGALVEGLEARAAQRSAAK